MKIKKPIKKLWGGRFSKETNKLAEEFTGSFSVDYRLYKHDIKGSIAHVKMLGKCGIILKKESKEIIQALKKVENKFPQVIKNKKLVFNSGFEDIHSYIERKVIDIVGEQIGSKLHTARSRNDQVALDTKLYMRDDMWEIITLLKEICKTIIKLAEDNPYTPMPGYTHMQLAKPIYFRDYIRTYLEMFSRDISRIINCAELMDYCPLGAGAVGGTHYKLDREFVANELKFSGIVENTIDAVSDRDFVIEYVFDLSMIAMHMSRLSEELILWLSPEFKFAEIDETFMTGSSILPQKKNPDVCELVRGKTGRLYGNLILLLTVMKGLPFSYNRDMQEDKEALFSSSDTIKIILKVYNKMLKTLKVNEKRMLEALKEEGYITAPYVVDRLVRRGVPLRKAHEIVGKLVHYCERENINFDRLKTEETKSFAKTELNEGEIKKLSEEIDDDLADFLEKCFKPK